MKVLSLLVVMATLSVSAITMAQETQTPVTTVSTVNPGGLATIRGAATIDQTRGYRVDLNSNKCLSCHSWKNAAETGATKISLTHFETREGMTLSDVSPRRYFCSQCHVTQADAAPLVGNTFKPVESLGNE